MTFIITLLQFSRTFTFQYGSNQIVDSDDAHRYLEVFTFQYGSNQICSSATDTEVILQFTFQYGSNQIHQRNFYQI